MNIFCVIVLLSVTANAFSWSSVGVRTTSRITRTTSLSMVATQPKHKSLEKVKARYSGREDLVSMLDNETDTDDSLSTDDTYELFAEADEEQMDPPQVGENIKGTVIEIDDNGALLEIGGKMSGYLPIKEAALVEPKNLNGILEIGQEITAEVIGTLRGMPVISLRTAQLIVAWDKILKLREADDEFETKIMEVNKGGAVCDVLGLKAFLPGSHYLGTPDQSIIGQTIKVCTDLLLL